MRLQRKGFSGIGACSALAWIFIFVVMCAVPTRAQVGANIGGVVRDTSDSAVPGITVTITNTNNGESQRLTTGSEGNYRAVNVQPAPYVITVEAKGFGTQKKSITLLVGSDQTVDFTLGVSQVQQNVTVTAAGETTIEVTKSEPSSVINDQQLAQLPVLDRNFLVIAQTMPGAATMSNLSVYPAFALTKFGGVADQRSGYTTILDGAPIDDPIWGTPVINESQDAIQEFKVFRDQFDAQYGNAMNAVVNVVTMAGGDRFHGTAYYFGRDEALDATNALATSKPPYRLWRTGGTIGGPVLSNNTHFFAAYENLNINTAGIEALPPSNPFATEENGIYPFTETENLFDTRVDHRFSTNDTFWVRYAYDNQFIPQGGPANYANNQVNYTRSHNLVAENDWVISPAKVNTLGFIFMHQNLYSLQTDPGAVAISRPSFYFGGNVDDPQYFPRMDETVYDTFFVNSAKQNIKFGGGLTHSSSSYSAHYYQYGQFTFATDAPFDPSNPATWPVEFQQESPGNFDYKSNQVYGFVQDDIAATHRLHFNVGLRYDLDTNLRDNAFYSSLLTNPAFTGINNFISSNRGNEWNNIQPRLGVTYDLNGKILLRAGYGRYVTRNRPWIDQSNEQSTIGAAVAITDPTQLSQYPNITAVLNGETLQQYVAAGGPRSIGINDNRYRVPYSDNFTVGFSWQMNHDTVLDVDGVFDKSNDEWATEDLNLPNGVLSATNPRPVPQFSQVNDVLNFGWASFHALEVQLHTKTKGFDNISVAYTYSQSLINAATFYSNYLYPNNYAYNPTNTPENLSVNFTSMMLPGKFRISAIFAGVSGGPETITAGFPLNGNQNPLSQLPPGLEQTVGDGDKASQLQLINAFRANPCGFAAVGAPCSATPVAPIPANLLNPQPIISLNTRITKVISLGDHGQLQLFFEGYNVFNHVTEFVSGAETSTLISPGFLSRDTALDPRLLQWGARFVF